MKFPVCMDSFGIPILYVLPVLLVGAAVPRPAPPGVRLNRGVAAISPARAVVPIAGIEFDQWKVLKDRKRLCQTVVPGDWAEALPGMAIPPGGGTHAALSSIPGGTMADVKTGVAMAFKPTKVTEDSPTRYAFLYGTSGLHSYAARAFPDLVCAVEVDVSATERAAALADDVKRIVESLERVH